MRPVPWSVAMLGHTWSVPRPDWVALRLQSTNACEESIRHALHEDQGVHGASGRTMLDDRSLALNHGADLIERAADTPQDPSHA